MNEKTTTDPKLTDELDDSVKPTHIVGVGASAGGLEAIEAFFKVMPPDSGVSFVVIQHLSPDHKSLMAELLSKRTRMPVHRAEDGVLVEPNSVYLIPPNKNLRLFHGRIILSEQDRDARGINLPIDIFFRSLAEDQGAKAIAIVLSGTGSDGTSGIRAIKEEL
ncbi:MAG: chemotaxis protein CheB, partial [Candidatus Thiodiazotropha taylori]|nr:chemotaxis protein CheB [Candidatus Thiodiazotropha taylori]MCW4252315.1 chemotaxis protein CheB [Candidatus Thiodiazotropha taylori]